MTKGFASRLKAELMQLLENNFYSEKLKLPCLKFHSSPSKPNYTSWLGGAIYGVVDVPTRCITKEKYLEINRIPDWANLLDNKREENSATI